MNNARQAKHWKVVEIQLRHAADFLHGPGKASIPENTFQELSNLSDLSEYELVMDNLVKIALEYGCKSGFWRRLKNAAIQMGLHDKADQYEKHFHDALQAREE